MQNAESIVIHPTDAQEVMGLSERKFYDMAKEQGWPKVKMQDRRVGYRVPCAN